MSHKAVETTWKINNTFGPGTANKHTVQWWFKKFCKWDKNLADEEHSGQPSQVDNNQLRAIIEVDPLTTVTLKNSMSTVPGSFSTWSKLERWKCLISGCLMRWLKIFKNRHFEVSSSLILFNNNELLLNLIVTCDEKWILYNNQRWSAQWLGWEEAPKHFPKPNLHQKKVMVTVWWFAAHLITTAF